MHDWRIHPLCGWSVTDGVDRAVFGGAVLVDELAGTYAVDGFGTQTATSITPGYR